MAKITILGGTGYTGSNLARVAAARGHDVTSISRSHPATPVDGVTYETTSLLNAAERTRVISGDVVLASLAPRGDLENELTAIYQDVAERAATTGTRLGVIGGFSALRPQAGAPRIAYTGEVPKEFAHEALVMAEFVDWLRKSSPENLDWFYVSPAAGYGSHVPGEARGVYRIGDDVALFDENGESAISGADFAAAVLDEVDKPSHRRAHFSVAY